MLPSDPYARLLLGFWVARGRATITEACQGSLQSLPANTPEVKLQIAPHNRFGRPQSGQFLPLRGDLYISILGLSTRFAGVCDIYQQRLAKRGPIFKSQIVDFPVSALIFEMKAQGCALVTIGAAPR